VARAKWPSPFSALDVAGSRQSATRFLSTRDDPIGSSKASALIATR
jgi:hypothetical protein